MSVLTNKMVVIIATDAPTGAALNTAALLGVGLGSHHPEAVGADTVDAAGTPHTGMCAHPIPILRTDDLRTLRARAAARPEITIHDMHQVAQRARTYDEMIATLAGTKPEDIEYLGLALYGPRRSIDSLTGALPLYR